jgi:hypothetical protein
MRAEQAAQESFVTAQLLNQLQSTPTASCALVDGFPVRAQILQCAHVNPAPRWMHLQLVLGMSQQ